MGCVTRTSVFALSGRVLAGLWRGFGGLVLSLGRCVAAEAEAFAGASRRPGCIRGARGRGAAKRAAPRLFSRCRAQAARGRVLKTGVPASCEPVGNSDRLTLPPVRRLRRCAGCARRCWCARSEHGLPAGFSPAPPAPLIIRLLNHPDVCFVRPVATKPPKR